MLEKGSFSVHLDVRPIFITKWRSNEGLPVIGTSIIPGTFFFFIFFLRPIVRAERVVVGEAYLHLGFQLKNSFNERRWLNGGWGMTDRPGHVILVQTVLPSLSLPLHCNSHAPYTGFFNSTFPRSTFFVPKLRKGKPFTFHLFLVLIPVSPSIFLQ